MINPEFDVKSVFFIYHTVETSMFRYSWINLPWDIVFINETYDAKYLSSKLRTFRTRLGLRLLKCHLINGVSDRNSLYRKLSIFEIECQRELKKN